MNENYQHLDKDGIIVGGSVDSNYSPALTLMNNFSTGHSGRSETYDNEILCSQSKSNFKMANFEVVQFEVWGFEFWLNLYHLL